MVRETALAVFASSKLHLCRWQGCDYITGTPRHNGQRGVAQTSASPAQPHSFDEYLHSMRSWDAIMQRELAARQADTSGAPDLASSTAGNTVIVQPSGAAGRALTELQRQVPACFFDTGFDIADVGTFQQACPIHLRDETKVTRELTGHLDLVRFAASRCMPALCTACVAALQMPLLQRGLDSAWHMSAATGSNTPCDAQKLVRRLIVPYPRRLTAALLTWWTQQATLAPCKRCCGGCTSEVRWRSATRRLHVTSPATMPRSLHV